MTMEPFNPSDPFDVATEAVRKEIAELIHRYWTKAPETADLSQEVRFQVIATALTVSLAATMKIMVNAPETHLIEMIRGSLPSAFATAAGIIADNVDPREVRH
ncbi:hypothetical protein BMW22_15935 [Rhizobium leguminosarum]|uniref:Uncharacterized protein n=1 Tax=Rhizobium leguminosarum TaxID=384 RepID=A0A1L3ZBF6_RHILE|nr:hypothetical protein [Rhizobium leguminosarum]API52912.1 hypothetical protein BMW22_15935 [Rhizobium leguminosarum]